MFFTNEDDIPGIGEEELLMTDGTPEGTMIAKDFFTDPTGEDNGANGYVVGSIGNSLIFLGDDNIVGRELRRVTVVDTPEVLIDVTQAQVEDLSTDVENSTEYNTTEKYYIGYYLDTADSFLNAAEQKVISGTDLYNAYSDLLNSSHNVYYAGSYGPEVDAIQNSIVDVSRNIMAEKMPSVEAVKNNNQYTQMYYQTVVDALANAEYYASIGEPTSAIGYFQIAHQYADYVIYYSAY